MTQPDLVSKLREVIARMHSAVRWDKGIAPLVVAGWADELESLLGREGQAARCNYYFGGFDGGNRCQRKLGHEGNVAHLWQADKEPCGPSQPETEGEAGRQPVRLSLDSPSVQAAPSTPIVPSTAGLSAIKVQSWANNCAVYERQHAAIGDFAGVEYHRGAKEAFQRVADALLGAERPAPAGEVELVLCPECHTDISKGHHSRLQGCLPGEVKGEK